jgi:hypothetical protein
MWHREWLGVRQRGQLTGLHLGKSLPSFCSGPVGKLCQRDRPGTMRPEELLNFSGVEFGKGLFRASVIPNSNLPIDLLNFHNSESAGVRDTVFQQSMIVVMVRILKDIPF